MKTVISKPAWKSKTVLVNVGIGLLALTDWLLTQDVPLMDEPWFLPAVTALNVALRWVTKKPVTATGGDPVQVDTP